MRGPGGRPSEEIVWRPSPERVAASNTKAFMDAHGIATVADEHPATHFAAAGDRRDGNDPAGGTGGGARS